MAHLLALTLARALALVVGFGSFTLYMAAFFFPEVHRKHDLTWSGVGLLYAVVLWFCAGQMEGALLLGQLSGVALLGWLGWQVLTLRRLKTPIQQQTLPGASSQELTQVALGQAKAAANNFSLAETATAIAGVTSSAIAAARGQSPSPRSTAQACPIDTSAIHTSAIHTSAAQSSKPAVEPLVTPSASPVRSQPERQQMPPSATINTSPVTQPKFESATRSSQPATYATDEEILQPIISPVDSTTAATFSTMPAADVETSAAATGDDDWGNWLEDEDLGDSAAETATLASAQADTVVQSFAQPTQSTVNRAASATDRTDQPSTPVGQSAQPQNQDQSKAGGLAGWVGSLLPFGRKKKSQPMVTLPPRESSLSRSSQGSQSTPVQPSQPMLTIPRRESSLRRPSVSTPSSPTKLPSTAEPERGESAIAPDLAQAAIPDSEATIGRNAAIGTNLDTSVNGVADAPTDQSPEPSPEEILIPESLPSDEEAWGRISAIATPEDDALTEAVLIEDAAMTHELDESGESDELDESGSDYEPGVDDFDAEDVGEQSEKSVWNSSSEPAVDGQVAENVAEDATDAAAAATDAIADAQPSAVSLAVPLADTDLTVTPASPSDEDSEAKDADDADNAEWSENISEAPATRNQDDAELAESMETAAPAQSDELNHEETYGNGQIDGVQIAEANLDSQETDPFTAPATIDEPELPSPSAPDQPALKRPKPPSPELLEELQRQHYTDAGRE